MFPKTGPLWKKTLVSRALLNISFRVLNKGAFPPGSHHRAPIDIETPFPEPSIRLSKCKGAPLQVPQRGPLWREMPISGAFLYISYRVPSKAAPPPRSGSPNGAPIERYGPFPEPSIYLSESPVNETPPPRFAYEDKCPFPEPRFTHPLTKKISPFSQSPRYWSPLPCSPNGTAMERDAPSPEPMVDSFIEICHESRVKELSHETGRKHTVTAHGASGERTIGCGLVPQGDRLRHC
jgi:hypothetical protein